MSKNIDESTVEGFGDEWERFDQSFLSPNEHKEIFDSYFRIFPWDKLKLDAKGFDLGCGSGRWAKLVAPRVGKLYLIDPSSAINIAKRNLADNTNCEFYQASVDSIPLPDESMDFGYSLGVLHHVPDTQTVMTNCVKKLKFGAPFLVYLYYAFDNRPFWFHLVWHISNILRIGISRLPYGIRYLISQIIALFIYLPLVKASSLLERLGINVNNIPLSSYRHKSFYTMRTDALDRFGTRLEKRFSKRKIKEMMVKAGLKNIKFSEDVPYWCAVGFRQNLIEGNS